MSFITPITRTIILGFSCIEFTNIMNCSCSTHRFVVPISLSYMNSSSPTMVFQSINMMTISLVKTLHCFKDRVCLNIPSCFEALEHLFGPSIKDDFIKPFFVKRNLEITNLLLNNFNGYNSISICILLLTNVKRCSHHITNFVTIYLLDAV